MESAMSDIDAYIMRFSPEVQQRLLTIRRITFDVFGDIGERVYFGIPTVSMAGKDILHYAAYKHHISLIVGYDWADFLKNERLKKRNSFTWKNCIIILFVLMILM